MGENYHLIDDPSLFNCSKGEIPNTLLFFNPGECVGELLFDVYMIGNMLLLVLGSILICKESKYFQLRKMTLFIHPIYVMIKRETRKNTKLVTIATIYMLWFNFFFLGYFIILYYYKKQTFYNYFCVYFCLIYQSSFVSVLLDIFIKLVASEAAAEKSCEIIFKIVRKYMDALNFQSLFMPIPMYLYTMYGAKTVSDYNIGVRQFYIVQSIPPVGGCAVSTLCLWKSQILFDRMIQSSGDVKSAEVFRTFKSKFEKFFIGFVIFMAIYSGVNIGMTLFSRNDTGLKYSEPIFYVHIMMFATNWTNLLNLIKRNNKVGKDTTVVNTATDNANSESTFNATNSAVMHGPSDYSSNHTCAAAVLPFPKQSHAKTEASW